MEHFGSITSSIVRLGLIQDDNWILYMASTGADIDTCLLDGHGPPTFRIKGKVSHLIGSLLPVEGQVSKVSQIYIDRSAHAQLDRRMIMTVYSGMNRAILRQL